MKLNLRISIVLIISTNLYACLNTEHTLDCGTYTKELGDFNAPCCFEEYYPFYVKDSFRDSDYNLSTKIKDEEFDINITSKEDFNGTLCINIDNKTEFIKSDFNNTGIFRLKSEYISRDSNVFIRYRENSDLNCSDTNETNTTSEEHFAIRPKRFYIEAPSTIRVNEDFNLTFSTLTKDYNESKSFDVIYYDTKGCGIGEFTKGSTIDISDFTFSDGNYTFKDIEYDNIGNLAIEIKEDSNCSKRFASIDCNDKEVGGWSIEDNLTIQEDKIQMDFKPYSFSLEAIPKSSRSNSDMNFTYIANIEDGEYAQFDTNISAIDENGNVLTNYNKECYANAINLKILTDNNSSAEYIIDKGYETNGLLDINLSKDIFSTDNNGSAQFDIKFNFKRDHKYPMSAFILESNITIRDGDINGSSNNKMNFLYCRYFVKDIWTNKSKITTKVRKIVYDDRHIFSSLNDEYILNWYYIGDGIDIIEANATRSYKLNSTIDSDITISDEVTIDKVKDSYIHFNTPKYYWYSYSVDVNYSYDTNSSCLNHPCLKVVFEDAGEKVSSGNFSGGDVEIKSHKYKKNGVKIFR